ncbi:MAG: hypothetical protein ABSH12_06465 [Endomicrobiales bacterium]|jgi:predicted DNA binding CopG/RHH family protein
MRKIKLNSYENEVEKDLLSGVYVPSSSMEFRSIASAIAHRKKDAVLNIRVNQQDLNKIKLKAKKLGLRYQTFISEIIHKVAI